jgi:hypothetical protein
MSWVTNLASGLGIPGAAATVAVAMYAGCAAAEKAARPEALKDIGRILKDTSWQGSVRPSAIIQRMFVSTFGERHLSWECFLASAYATIIFCAWMATIAGFVTKRKIYGFAPSQLFYHPMLTLLSWALLGATTLAPDYIALWKTRLLTQRLVADTGALRGMTLVILDVMLSMLISIVTVYGVYVAAVSVTLYLVLHSMPLIGTLLQNIVLNTLLPPDEINSAIVHYQLTKSAPDVTKLLLDGVFNLFQPKSTTLSTFAITFWSTMLTSVWAVLILLSTTVLKMLAPLQRFTKWFFNVEERPLQAVGIMAGALVMFGSLIWTGLRAIL